MERRARKCLVRSTASGNLNACLNDSSAYGCSVWGHDLADECDWSRQSPPIRVNRMHLNTQMRQVVKTEVVHYEESSLLLVTNAIIMSCGMQ